MTKDGKGPNLAFKRSGAIRVNRTRGTVGASPWILYQWFFRCWPQLAREKLWETFVPGGRMCSGANFKLSLAPGQVLTMVQWVNPIVMLWSGENSRLHLPPQMRPVLLPGKGRLGPLRGAPRTPRLCTGLPPVRSVGAGSWGCLPPALGSAASKKKPGGCHGHTRQGPPIITKKSFLARRASNWPRRLNVVLSWFCRAMVLGETWAWRERLWVRVIFLSSVGWEEYTQHIPVSRWVNPEVVSSTVWHHGKPAHFHPAVVTVVT